MAWFICPYERRTDVEGVERFCSMNRFTSLIAADGGGWAEAECLGNHAVVKVRASASVLATINAEPGFIRLPRDILNDPLASLTNPQKLAIRNKLLELGYSLSEIINDLGNDIGTKTLRDVLRFALKRRHKPRYDSLTDSIILDGPIQACTPIERLDTRISLWLSVKR